MTCVLDASMTLSFIFNDEFTPASDRALTLIASHGAVVPPLWDYEIASAVTNATNQSRISEADAAAALHALSNLRIIRSDRPVDISHLVALAHAYGLTAYDAAYLALAMHGGLPLATLDRRLAAAASRAGVPVLQ
ncbi:MAG: type II toxin-antitoxin system VapC family toxin [Actinomycetota bacterium]|nr:type II toxin-antitoxin system VapC family toxin [Actinomycetota bacterium]